MEVIVFVANTGGVVARLGQAGWSHLPVGLLSDHNLMEASPLAYASGNGQVRRYSSVTVCPVACLTK